MYAIMYGNPRTGFRFIGPFVDYEDAINYTSRITGACWVMSLDPPLRRPVTDDEYE